MLSVFMTPWMKPSSIQSATSTAWRCVDLLQYCQRGHVGVTGRGVVSCDDVLQQHPDGILIAAGRKVLKCPYPHVACCHPS